MWIAICYCWMLILCSHICRMFILKTKIIFDFFRTYLFFGWGFTLVLIECLTYVIKYADVSLNQSTEGFQMLPAINNYGIIVR